jgi:Asp-tRNA(Asn)/Glu-tRNA(Gln) amidotransferase A subunit family amidase
MRNVFIPILALATCTVVSVFGQQRSSAAAFPLDELAVAQLQDAMSSGRYTARRLVELYTERINAIDQNGPELRSVIELNPDAISIADALDVERKNGRVRGPLHGIPILIKDNIDTGDRMMTTAGSVALQGPPSPRDAFVVGRLRAAGAVILGKTNLSEWANFRSTKSTSGWSGRGGQVGNPYALDRNPCGSSSGTGAAIAANLAAIGVGTETDGSIVCPSGANALVGIKPTIGLVSRTGIIPISHTQDTAGPMTRTVTDAALLLGAIAGPDVDDRATITGRARVDYLAALKEDALKGARIGVARKRYFGYSAVADTLIDAAIVEMKAQGAVIVDPADIPTAARLDDCEFEILLYEFKADLNKYLATRGPSVAVHSGTRAGNAVLRSGDFDQRREEGASDVAGVPKGADDVPRALTHSWNRCRHDKTPARCARRANRQPGVANRSRQWRSFPRRQFNPGGGGWLSQHHRAGRVRVRIAGRRFVHRPPLERSKADRIRLRLRASHETQEAADVCGHGEYEIASRDPGPRIRARIRSDPASLQSPVIRLSPCPSALQIRYAGEGAPGRSGPVRPPCRARSSGAPQRRTHR